MAHTEKVLVEGEKPDGDKLGPGVTYNPPEGHAKIVQMRGVTFKAGEQVDLAKELGEKEAQPMLQKLAGNPFFQVAGGPEHEPLQERNDRQFRAGVVGSQVMDAERDARLAGQEPPEDYDAPLMAVLEGGSAPPAVGKPSEEISESQKARNQEQQKEQEEQQKAQQRPKLSGRDK